MTQFEPLVSVIMNCRNGGKFLAEAIDSIYRQNYFNWEIIFWDNLSTDNSAEIAKSYDRRLRYFRGESIQPLGRARNMAIAQAKGELIAFLDADDLWMPDKLQKQVLLFRNDLVGLVFSDAINLFSTTNTYYTQFSTLSILPPRGRIFDYLLEKYGVSMPTVVLRREAMESAGGLFDDAFQYSEEYDLFLRISYNWECDYVAEPLAVYRIHQSLGLSAFSQFEAQERQKTIDKLCLIYPELKDRCRDLLQVCRVNIAVVQARWFWKQGKVSEARAELKQYLSYPKVLLIYISTLLPYGLVMKLWRFAQELKHKGMKHSKFNGIDSFVAGNK